MSKNCLFYLTTKQNKYSDFIQLKDKIGDFIDCYFFIDNKEISMSDDNIICFNGNDIWKKYNNFSNDLNKMYVGNPQFLPIEYNEQPKFNEYENIYFIEDDIALPNGDVRLFFQQCENVDCDLLLTNDDYINPTDRWWWYSQMPKNIKYKYPLHNYIQLFRISKQGCKTIKDNFCKNDKAHSECAIPSIIYRNGLTTKFMYKETIFNFRIDFKIHNEWLTGNFTPVINTWYHPIK